MEKKYNLDQLKDEKKLQILKKMMDENMDIRIVLDKEYSHFQMNEIYLSIKHGLNMEQISLIKKFDNWEMEQIRLGYESDLVSNEQVESYADLRFNAKQMEQIRLGHENDLVSNAQVESYADLRFNADQMEQIRLGYEHGLNDKQVKSYTHEKFTSSQMNRLVPKLFICNFKIINTTN